MPIVEKEGNLTASKTTFNARSPIEFSVEMANDSILALDHLLHRDKLALFRYDSMNAKEFIKAIVQNNDVEDASAEEEFLVVAYQKLLTTSRNNERTKESEKSVKERFKNHLIRVFLEFIAQMQAMEVEFQNVGCKKVIFRFA